MYSIEVYDHIIPKLGPVTRWMAENKIRHTPAYKSDSGWYFKVYDIADATAFKMMWSNGIDMEKDYEPPKKR